MMSAAPPPNRWRGRNGQGRFVPQQMEHEEI